MSPLGCPGFYFRLAPRAAPGSPGVIQEPPSPSSTAEPPGCDADRSAGKWPEILILIPEILIPGFLSQVPLAFRVSPSIWLRRQLEAEAGELQAEGVTQEVKSGEGPLGITDVLAGCRQEEAGIPLLSWTGC